MLRNLSMSSRPLRAFILGVATLTTAVIFTTDTADARKSRRHNAARYSYSPAFASIIVDANSGAVLAANNPDAARHPASLTKIMTLYMLFERLEAGRLKLDSELPVSANAASQPPTKLGLRPGQTIRVEDAIKGLVTRSANDASVVIAEALAGSEGEFARMMTRKARALGMNRTIYRNASGLPDANQITSARDQAILGRAIQDRFPRYYRYFSTNSFVWRGRPIRNHNRLLGQVEGVDGIKTGYTRASGFNLVSSIKRGNRHLVGVVLGGRSGGSRDATMRQLLAQNLDKGATRRTIAAITEQGGQDVASAAPAAVAIALPTARPNTPPDVIQVDGAVQVASAGLDADRTATTANRPAASVPLPLLKPEPAPLTNGVVQSNAMPLIPGAAEPMKPVRVRTVQVRAGQVQVASTNQIAPPMPLAQPPQSRPATAESSGSIVERAELPQQPSSHGTGQGILGVLPASALNKHSQQLAYAEPTKLQVTPAATPASAKPVSAHSGWIIQVGALESESQARNRLDAAREQARGLLKKADPFTETVESRGKTIYRARFAGLDRREAEAACKTLKRSDIACITIRN